MEIEYLKSTARLLKRNCVNRRGLDFSEEVLWVSEGQRAAELLAVKVGGQKRILLLAQLESDLPAPGRVVDFFLPPTLTDGSSAALLTTETHF